LSARISVQTTGIGGWTEEAFISALRNGIGRSGQLNYTKHQKDLWVKHGLSIFVIFQSFFLINPVFQFLKQADIFLVKNSRIKNYPSPIQPN
jgi:hypothetical protein